MAFREFYINKEGKAEKVDYIHHVEETEDKTLEVAFTSPQDAPDLLEIAMRRISLPNPGWDHSYKAEKVKQLELASDDPRRDDPWTGKDRAWFVYRIIDEIDFPT